MSTHRRLSGQVLVVAQLSGIAVACIPFGSVGRGASAWLVLCAAGALLGVATLFWNRPGNFSIFPEPLARARLIRSGPYRWIRHPMYSAVMLFVAGAAGFGGHWLNVAGAVAASVAMFGKALLEERYLRAQFPGYAEYCAERRRFVPFVI